MPPPAVHSFTATVYQRLPLCYRDADEKQEWPLLKWLSLLVDQLGAVADVVDRITMDDDDPASSSALTDPATADETWLPWLAQLVGLKTNVTSGRGYGSGLYGSGPYGGGLSSAGASDLRTRIRQHTFARGSHGAFDTIIRRHLVDGASYTLDERVGDQWHYTITVASADVTDEDSLVAALSAENPAGMVLTVDVVPTAVYPGAAVYPSPTLFPEG